MDIKICAYVQTGYFSSVYSHLSFDDFSDKWYLCGGSHAWALWLLIQVIPCFVFVPFTFCYLLVPTLFFQGEGMLPYFANFRLLAEFSTPCVNQRYVFAHFYTWFLRPFHFSQLFILYLLLFLEYTTQTVQLEACTI